MFIYIYFAATCFGPRWPSSGGIHNYLLEVTPLQRIKIINAGIPIMLRYIILIQYCEYVQCFQLMLGKPLMMTKIGRNI
jgi:hypothetical protein